MRRLISADLKRVFQKPGLYVTVVLMILVVMLRKPGDTASEQMDYYRLFFNSIGLTFVCIPIFLSIYGDELRSGILITAIGMGMQRRKIILAKLLDCLILLICSYTVLFIFAVVKNAISGLAVTPRQSVFLFIFCLFCVVRGIGLFALSSLVLFLTFSVAGGMLVLIICGVTAGPLLKGIQSYSNLPFYNYSYMGLLDNAFVDLQTGVISLNYIAPLLYLALVIFVTVILFDRKELEL